MKYRGAISGGEVDLFLFDVEERGNLLLHGTTPFVHLYIRIHTCLDVRIMLTHYWQVYRKSEVFKDESASSALAQERSDTLDEMFSVKYRVAISGGEVDLFLFDLEQ